MVLLPAMAMAAPPLPVTGVTATVEQNGSIRVRWEAEPEQVRARIYWSYLSILGEDGAYDDYAVSEGPGGEFVIENPPEVARLYIAIIAENGAGEESPFFTEEASVDLGSAVPSSVAAESSSSASMQPFPSSASVASMDVQASSAMSFAAMSSAPAMQDNGFHLVSAVAESPTRVVLTFTHPVAVDPKTAAQAFLVAATDGRMLPLTRIEVRENQAALTTMPQERGVAYQVTVTSAVSGVRFEGMRQIPVPFAGPSETTDFAGHLSGTEPAVPVTPQANDLELRPTSIGGGLYRIEAALPSPMPEGLVQYNVYQSIDGGRTYNNPQVVRAGTPSVRVDGVSPGAFVMVLEPVFAGGRVGTPLVASVTLDGSIMMPPVTSRAAQTSSFATVPAQPTAPRSSSLPGAGAGILAVLTAGSGWAVFRHIRRRKAAGSVAV